MQNRRNLYRTLQVQPDAPLEVIKSNYRTMMQKLRLHPDLGGDNANASQINHAYQVLKNTQKRANYDRELLHNYHIKVLSQGHLAGDLKGPQPSVKASNEDGTNRRNYYRILHIQTDASAAIIVASYNIQMKNPQVPIELIQEAYAVLSDPKLRSAYDKSLKTSTHINSISPEQPTPSQPDISNNRTESPQPPPPPIPSPYASPYQPLITQYCYFCKTPHVHSSMGAHNELCIECDSPLFAGLQESLNRRQRELPRATLQGRLQIFHNWPDSQFPGALTDLSPDGLRFTTPQRLSPSQIIKVESAQFKCVAEVMHRKPDAYGESVGSRFITVLFNHQQGNFISMKA